ncbi:MAG: hypothetical protein UV38_C0003G0141 [candidate division TM6 bacterium GW2011_GWE2_42_60]|nr:MAG: hypothetical protein UV38_C0003G0141 [candidate division TM6 bacterium GW2011_GWE2_42_60]HBY05381.1 hypothetical protein [Candidatus Dependentiae bacterium]
MFKKIFTLLVIGTGLCSFQPSQAEMTVRSNLLYKVAFPAINSRIGTCIDIATSFTPFLALNRNKNMSTLEKVCSCTILGAIPVFLKFLPSLPLLKEKLGRQGKLKLLGSFNAAYAGIDLATILLLNDQKISRPIFWSLFASAGWNAVSAGLRFYRAAHIRNKDKEDKKIEKANKLKVENKKEDEESKTPKQPVTPQIAILIDPKTQEVSEEKKKILDKFHEILRELESNISYTARNTLDGNLCAKDGVEKACADLCTDLNKFFVFFDEKPSIKSLTDEDAINKIDYELFEKWAENKDIETLKTKLQELIELAVKTGLERGIIASI